MVAEKIRDLMIVIQLMINKLLLIILHCLNCINFCMLVLYSEVQNDHKSSDREFFLPSPCYLEVVIFIIFLFVIILIGLRYYSIRGFSLCHIISVQHFFFLIWLVSLFMQSEFITIVLLFLHYCRVNSYDHRFFFRYFLYVIILV